MTRNVLSLAILAIVGFGAHQAHAAGYFIGRDHYLPGCRPIGHHVCCQVYRPPYIDNTHLTHRRYNPPQGTYQVSAPPANMLQIK